MCRRTPQQGCRVELLCQKEQITQTCGQMQAGDAAPEMASLMFWLMRTSFGNCRSCLKTSNRMGLDIAPTTHQPGEVGKRRRAIVAQHQAGEHNTTYPIRSRNPSQKRTSTHSQQLGPSTQTPLPACVSKGEHEAGWVVRPCSCAMGCDKGAPAELFWLLRHRLAAVDTTSDHRAFHGLAHPEQAVAAATKRSPHMRSEAQRPPQLCGPWAPPPPLVLAASFEVGLIQNTVGS